MEAEMRRNERMMNNPKTQEMLANQMKIAMEQQARMMNDPNMQRMMQQNMAMVLKMQQDPNIQQLLRQQQQAFMANPQMMQQMMMHSNMAAMTEANGSSSNNNNDNNNYDAYSTTMPAIDPFRSEITSSGVTNTGNNATDGTGAQMSIAEQMLSDLNSTPY